MGTCSYCYKWIRDECFGWDEARRCCGISGPEDPTRLKAIISHAKCETVEVERKIAELDDRHKFERGLLTGRIAGLEQSAARARTALKDAEAAE